MGHTKLSVRSQLVALTHTFPSTYQSPELSTGGAAYRWCCPQVALPTSPAAGSLTCPPHRIRWMPLQSSGNTEHNSEVQEFSITKVMKRKKHKSKCLQQKVTRKPQRGRVWQRTPATLRLGRVGVQGQPQPCEILSQNDKEKLRESWPNHHYVFL